MSLRPGIADNQHPPDSDELRKALQMAQRNTPSKRDEGEVARIQRKLAEALEMKGELEEAAKLKNLAETMRKEIQGARFESLPDCDLSYAMMNHFDLW